MRARVEAQLYCKEYQLYKEWRYERTMAKVSTIFSLVNQNMAPTAQTSKVVFRKQKRNLVNQNK